VGRPTENRGRGGGAAPRSAWLPNTAAGALTAAPAGAPSGALLAAASYSQAAAAAVAAAAARPNGAASLSLPKPAGAPAPPPPPLSGLQGAAGARTQEPCALRSPQGEEEEGPVGGVKRAREE
jgi:hypothetical protein